MQVLTLKLTPNRADCLSPARRGARSRRADRRGAQAAADRRRFRARSTHAIPVKHHRAGGLRPLRRPRDPQRQRRGADARRGWCSAWSAPASARFPRWSTSPTTSCSNSAGRCTSTTSTSCAAAIDVRFGRAGRAVQAAERADGRGGRERALHHRRLRARSASPASWAATRTKAETRQPEHLPRVRVLLSRSDRRARARATISRATPSHRFERGVDFDNNVDGIERATRADPRRSAAASPARPWTTGRAPARAQAGARAQRARARRSSASTCTDDEIGRRFSRVSASPRAKTADGVRA